MGIKITILVLYLILLIISTCFITYRRYKKVSNNVNSKNYEILNHDYFIRIVLLVLNVLLVILTINLIFVETCSIYLVISVILSFLVSVFLIILIQLYTLLFLIVYSDDKIYLFLNGELAVFDRDRVHFSRKNKHTLMYYKDDLVFDTKKYLNLKKITK